MTFWQQIQQFLHVITGGLVPAPQVAPAVVLPTIINPGTGVPVAKEIAVAKAQSDTPSGIDPVAQAAQDALLAEDPGNPLAGINSAPPPPAPAVPDPNAVAALAKAKLTLVPPPPAVSPPKP